MRVVGGSARGTKLLAVPGENTRPILDRVKAALFDVIRFELENKNFLDAFAGTGSVGIEALSQGVSRCTFLDMESTAVETIKKNLQKTHFAFAKPEDPAEVRHCDAFGFLRNTRKIFDIIYIAPPQYQALWEQTLITIAERPDIVSESGLLIAQIDPKEYTALQMADFREEQQRKYGNTLLVFYRQR